MKKKKKKKTVRVFTSVKPRVEAFETDFNSLLLTILKPYAFQARGSTHHIRIRGCVTRRPCEEDAEERVVRAWAAVQSLAETTAVVTTRTPPPSTNATAAAASNTSEVGGL